jgi:hypothetical protein
VRVLGLLSLALLAGCSRDAGNPAPPRLPAGGLTLPDETSTIVVPVTADLAALERGLDAGTPRTLWQIDEHRPACIAGRRVAGVKVTPDLGCRIIGEATRGRIAIAGTGERITITLPVSATIRVRDLGGMVGETATGSALVTAVARLGLRGDWQPTARTDLTYRWRQEPGIELLGRRVTFTRQADERLRRLVPELERDLPRELAKIDLKRQLDAVWRRAFTSIQLSRSNPPAWMRITPHRLGFGGYRVEGRTLRLLLSADARTETFVGDRPDDPAPTALPPPSRVASRPGLRFHIPVLADYRELEPVVQRELRELAARGISLTGVGPVDATFGKVTVYATEGNRLAVGVEATVKARSGSLGTTRGEVWLSALPWNEPDSQLVRARDVRFATKTDSAVVNMLTALFENPAVRASVEGALTHDFAPDYREVIAKAQAAIGSRQEGDFLLSATITKVGNGRIDATGDGLFLPVRAEGEARIAYRPR